MAGELEAFDLSTWEIRKSEKSKVQLRSVWTSDIFHFLCCIRRKEKPAQVFYGVVQCSMTRDERRLTNRFVNIEQARVESPHARGKLNLQCKLISSAYQSPHYCRADVTHYKFFRKITLIIYWIIRPRAAGMRTTNLRTRWRDLSDFHEMLIRKSVVWRFTFKALTTAPTLMCFFSPASEQASKINKLIQFASSESFETGKNSLLIALNSLLIATEFLELASKSWMSEDPISLFVEWRQRWLWGKFLSRQNFFFLFLYLSRTVETTLMASLTATWATTCVEQKTKDDSVFSLVRESLKAPASFVSFSFTLKLNLLDDVNLRRNLSWCERIDVGRLI